MLSRISWLRSSFLGGLLVIALGVTGVVTYRAYVASREYRAIVERVINDYVAVASYQMMQATEHSMYSCLTTWFRELPRPIAEWENDARLNECGNRNRSRFVFESDSREFITHGGPIPAPLLRWLQDTIPTHATLHWGAGWNLGILSSDKLAADEFIAYAIHSEPGKPNHVIGFIGRSSSDFILARVFETLSLLPQDLTKGASNSDLFSARLDPPSAKRQKAPYEARLNMHPAFGGLSIVVSLKPSALDRIIPGGIPEPKGYELLGMFALALGLVASSLLLLHREAQLTGMRAGFVSSVSHELRTPLAQIRMFAEMLLLGRLRNDAERRRSLQVIDNEARRLSQLVENVLQVARSENNTVRVNPTDTRIAPVVRESAETFMVLAEARNIELRLELQENLVVPIDTAAIQQIMLNLLDNAAKYGPMGQRVVVGLALFGHHARLWVDDEGPGVPMRERERVFEAFYRSRRDLQSHTTGSGIGLAVVRELAVLHGGRAYIEDAPGTGARVVVEFPGAYLAAERPATSDWAVA